MGSASYSRPYALASSAVVYFHSFLVVVVLLIIKKGRLQIFGKGNYILKLIS